MKHACLENVKRRYHQEIRHYLFQNLFWDCGGQTKIIVFHGSSMSVFIENWENYCGRGLASLAKQQQDKGLVGITSI
jgi:hypothetical protein